MEHFDQWPLLASVDRPADLKALSAKQLKPLADEIRDYLVYRVGENGGHLASNLGMVELTLALHRVFDVPRDHFVFDVGHQSYVHKLLTGRKADFDTLRIPGGLSGFTKRAESDCDPIGAGHSSTAISAAIGMAEADAVAGREDWTVAVVGDGALTGGLAYEGLNNCRRNPRLLIVINENEMSISPNTGRLARHMSRLRASREYIGTKAVTSFVLRHIPLIGPLLYRIVRRLKRKLKNTLYHENLFEHMGLRYYGPVDGNDLHELEEILRDIKRLDSTVILHVKTKKGKGYPPAEQDPNAYHSLPPKGKTPPVHSFSKEMGKALCALAKEQGDVCAITAAMRDGTGLAAFAEQYPKRFFDVGIAEGHALTFAAGLAAGGARPVVAVYSTFLQRAYDNILHDVALQGLPVTLCIDRAGLNAADGATHHGVFDVAMLSALPNVRIFTPVTALGISRALRAAVSHDGLAALRYPAGEPSELLRSAFYPDGEEGGIGVRAWQSTPDPVATVVTHGRIAEQALLAAGQLADEGLGVRILLCEYIAPYHDLAAEIAPLLCGDAILFLEEEVRAGGFGMNLSDALCRMATTPLPRLAIMAAEHGFIQPVSGQTAPEAAGLDAVSIKNTLHTLCAKGD